ncbi:hypothetical protein pb186bvf_016388 [Paramecium bursaria]
MDQQYKGGCHCKKVLFEFTSSSHMEIIKCNCSICWMKQNHHVLIPKTNFTLLKGEEELQLYTFNTQIAKHYFCKTCGVEPYYFPRSNTEMVAVTIYCVQLLPTTTVTFVVKDQNAPQ